MSKFRRVAETQDVPDYIQKQFIPESVEQNDIYSNLKESARRHKFVVAQEASGVSKTAPEQPKEWERIASAETYHQPRMLPSDESLSNMSPEDLSPHAIRRAGYDIDEGENSRPGKFQWGTDGDVTAALLRGASIFENDMEDISDMLVQENKERVAKFTTEQEQRRQAELRHTQWQQEQQNLLRPRTIVSSRANPIIRTGMENVADSSFGTYDYNGIEDRERQKVAMAETKRQQKLAISRVGSEPENNWQDDLDVYANTYQTYHKDWLDNFGE